jgi:hypothetical protein
MNDVSPNTSVLKPNAWEHFLRRKDGQEYCVLNNVWGLSSEEFASTRHVISFDATADTVAWRAQIPSILFDPAKVRSYQQAYSGIKDPNLPGCGLDQFPCKLGDTKDLNTHIAFHIQTDQPRRSNAAAEIFLHSQGKPIIGGPSDTREFELMVWMQSPDPNQINLNTIGTLTDTTDTYGLYLRESQNYAAFIFNQDVNDARVNWLQLIEVVKPYFPGIDFDELWLTAVEFGTEVYSGEVELELLNFTHTVTKVGADANPGTGTDTHTDIPASMGIEDALNLSQLLNQQHAEILNRVHDVIRAVSQPQFAGLVTDVEHRKLCDMVASGYLSDIALINNIKHRVSEHILRLKHE